MITHKTAVHQPQLSPTPKHGHPSPGTIRPSCRPDDPDRSHSSRCWHCALKPIAHEPMPALSAPTLWPKHPPPGACTGWSCQHPSGRPILGVAELLGTHWVRLSKCSQGSLHVSWGRACGRLGTWAPGHVGACLSSEARGEDGPVHERPPGHQLPRVALIPLPATLQATQAIRWQAAWACVRAMATVTPMKAMEPSDFKTKPESLSGPSFTSPATLTIKSPGT